MKGSDKAVSRRGFLERCACGLAITGAAALPAWAEVPVTDVAYKRHKKVSMAAAHYQYHPHGRQHCSVCRHFRPPGSCEVVAGAIVPNGWCRYFAARAAASPGGGY